jgi:2',3'-cyclic-nucleotide 2'-phosphodiesterase (5'-nucleotidase family)
MKSKYVLYAVFSLSALFAAVSSYLYFSEKDGAGLASVGSNIPKVEPSSAPENPQATNAPASGKGGNLVIAYSGDIAGRIDPCPCTQPAMGGFARRATAIRDYRLANPGKPFLLLETGSEFSQSDNLADPINTFIAQGLELLGVHAVHATYGDIRRLNILDKAGKLPNPLRAAFIASQLEPAAESRSRVKRYSIQTLRQEKENREVRIGILAVGKSAIDAPDLGRVVPIDESLKKLLPQAESQSDLTVLLTRMKPEEIYDIARKFPSLDVIINGDPSSEGRELERTGNTVIVEAAHLGIAVGMLDLQWDDRGRITKYSNQIIPLPPNVPDSPELAKLVDQAHREIAAFKEAQARSAPALTSPRNYAGAAVCKKCHEKEYKSWEKSAHARSLQSLKLKGNQFNEDCLTCHVAGAGEQQGFVDVVRTPNMAAVICEACHLPAVEHSRNPKAIHPGIGPFQFTKFRVTEKMCVRCHNPEQSPKFNFAEYWKRIEH